ncbi:MAG TPA: PepSY-associated TM helix domain-containing protein, partial [Novosphingobium sp.]|nr:PepSY-associated TM helix domain-containing protein [Novosphingobium sp.]
MEVVEHRKAVGGTQDAAHTRSTDGNVARTNVAQMKQSRPRKSSRQFWMKQLHTWHWVSAAVSLVAMFLFSITGFTLNHAASIGAEPTVETAQAQLPAPALAVLAKGPAVAELTDAQPLPATVAADVQRLVGVNARGVAAEWSDAEVYVAVPGPGRDAWVSIDRATGAMEAERTNRGFISFINDLHKGRNTGTAWFWLIDALAVACVI